MWVVAREPFSGVFVDESLVHQPLDGPKPGPGITQGLPRRAHFRVEFVDLVLEAPERSFPLQRLAQSSASGAVADAIGEVGRVLVPHVGREGVDEDEIQLVDLDGGSASMPVSLAQ